MWDVMQIFSIEIRKVLAKANLAVSDLQEIRMRVNRPLLCKYKGTEYTIEPDGKLSGELQKGFLVEKKEIQETMEYVSNYSLYAYEEELRQGFLTIQGGHRVGIAGKVIVDRGLIRNIKYISFLNIRFAHQILGCGETVFPYITHSGGMYHTLIVSPPGCGKTTLLRDCIRLLSNGWKDFAGRTVGVVDERSEIAGCYLGVPQNDVGIRTDVMDCCPKTEGIRMLIRSMTPQILAVDEIGSKEEARAIEEAMHTGCTLLATVHGTDFDDLKGKPVFLKMMQEQQIERYVFLESKGRIGSINWIADKNGEEIAYDQSGWSGNGLNCLHGNGDS